MLKSIQGRLSLLFIAFTVLLLISVGATYWGVETQRQDALVINLAGRQRMLIQQMARLALESRSDATKTAHALLEEAQETFDQTLNALRDGGPAPYSPDSTIILPGTKKPEIRAAIDELDLAWNQFHASLDTVVTSTPDISSETIGEQATELVAQADSVVRLFQAEAVAKVNLLRIIQLSFLGCALALLIVGGWVTRQSLLRPLNELKVAANRLGENDLRTPIQVQGPDEMRSLSHFFDLMRGNLLSSQQELVALNDSLEKRVAQRTLELESLNEVSREIISQLDIRQVLNLITEKARLLLGADVATLCLLDNDNRWLDLRALSGPGEAVVRERIPATAELAATIMQGDHAMLCASGQCVGGCQMLDKAYRTSQLAAPLRVGEHVIGAFCVGSPLPDHFPAEAAESLTKLANTAAIALENARLYSQAERVATLEERNRIAAEMHDGIGQTLSYLGLMTDQVVDFLSEGQSAEAFARLQKAREKINQAALDIRQAINQLLDESPLNQDLCVSLEESVKNFELQHQLSIEWCNQLSLAVQCSRDSAEQVTKIVTEALTNVMRHAEARQVVVTLGKNEDDFQVVVKDDGRGFFVPSAKQDGHYGLKVMEVRANHIDGKVSVESEPGAGTQVTLTWPVEQKGQP